ncbi:hypothetical protein FIV42_04090 [Persicimonas caeni]|uniref:Uncharacterized protein n=1 Tax=Persicimonas caeni TaxID=2292766 RepID=A0A4Y6PPM1_PERCE|nr:hypothetical protein [Persicimonas caeni]QDG49947.1 hypothetical protein FIV42_04090 [Persicimonas caeni]QED31168.1 hypothetical protein FRD00_04085 [Persicimonas caeni]
MGGRSIIHARCHDCGANLLAEVMDFEEEVTGVNANQPPPDDPPTAPSPTTADLEEASSTLEEDTQAVSQS